MSFTFTAGDTGSTLVVTCVDQQGNRVSLDSAQSVKLYWKIGNSPRVIADMTPDADQSANPGVVRYTFGTDELKGGDMVAEVEVIDVTGKKLTQLAPYEFTIRQRIPA